MRKKHNCFWKPVVFREDPTAYFQTMSSHFPSQNRICVWGFKNIALDDMN